MPAIQRTIVYSPFDPDQVASVNPFVLYSNAARTTAVQTLTNGTQNADGTWNFVVTIDDGTYYTKATVTYDDATVVVDTDDLVTLIAPTAARWSFVFCPKLGGRDYDPEAFGGQVTMLSLSDPVTGGLVADVGSARRLSSGSYLFEIPTSVPAGIYFGQVTWRPNAYETLYTESDLIIELPSRKNTLIKPWVTLQEVYRYNSEIKDIDPVIVQDAIYAATQSLYQLSGKKYRGIQVYNELYTPTCLPSFNTSWSNGAPARQDARRQGCGCSRDGIFLRRRPVQHVYQVSYDASGDIIPRTSYAVDNMNRLTGSYSKHSDIRITYAAGVGPTQLAKTACIALAGEIALYHAGSDSCRLPKNVSSITREGISFTITDKQEFLDRGLVGIYEVDLFLRSVNPDKARSRARVLTADQSRGRQTSVLRSSCVISTQSLSVSTGEITTFSYYWREFNTPHLITGYYTIRAKSGDTVLDSYITVEPNSAPGVIKLSIPAAVSDTLVDGASWYLESVSINTGQVNRLATGEVRRIS